MPLTTIVAAGDLLLNATLALEPGPRHLFGALQALPVSDNPYARLWRATELVREHRGDSHLAACVAAGLTMAEMNVFTEVWLGFPVGAYSATRGFSEAQLNTAVDTFVRRGWMDNERLTPTGANVRERIELATDAGQEQLVRALGSLLDDLCVQLETVSAAVLAAHAAPADPRKRAAG